MTISTLPFKVMTVSFATILDIRVEGLEYINGCFGPAGAGVMVGWWWRGSEMIESIGLPSSLRV